MKEYQVRHSNHRHGGKVEVLQFMTALTDSTFFSKDAQLISSVRVIPDSLAIKG